MPDPEPEQDILQEQPTEATTPADDVNAAVVEAKELVAEAQVPEVKNGRTIFLAGWRPFLGWVCGLALFWSWVVAPIVQSIGNFFSRSTLLVTIDDNKIYAMVVLLTGLTAARTFEKFKGLTK